MLDVLIEARSAIYDLAMRQATALDRGDYVALAACFKPDVHVDYEGRHLHGLEPFIAHLRTQYAYPILMHFVGNQLIDVKGDAADVETYCIAHLCENGAEGKRITFRGLRYIDHLVKQNGEWRVTARVQACDWVRREALSFVTEKRPA